MKKCCVILVLCLYLIPLKARPQSAEIEQLLLNLEKLSQFKKILQNMYDGYQVLHQGYTTIKDISEGSFSLHHSFLDALMQVSPAVKKYRRIAEIIDYQLRIVKHSKEGLAHFREQKIFSADELQYVENLFASVLAKSLQNLDELSMVIMAGRLRMSDDERLQAIDKIYLSITDQFSFLKQFTGSTSLLALQRLHEKADLKQSSAISGFNK
jgi:hypothetical protein